MNPGAWVKGGGAGGGGGSGNGDGSGNGEGADGNNGGDGADGDGRGANGCGQGNGGGCNNPAHGGNGGTAAGDPVDVTSGRVFTTPIVDLVLPGPLLLVLKREYSSKAIERDIGLGAGWSHSLAWEIVVRRRTLVIYRPDGTRAVWPTPRVGSILDLGDGDRLRREQASFSLTDAKGWVHLFMPAQANASRWVLQAMLDLRGNRVVLSYAAGQLEGLVDSAGRHVRVRRHADGHIAAFEVNGGSGRWVAFRRYEYAGHDLVGATDGEGNRMSYSYDAEHRLTELRYATGLTVSYRYDSRGRCRETWCATPGPGPDGRDPALADNVPGVLADHVTPARGVLHCRFEYAPDFTEVVDSKQVRRYEGNRFGTVDKVASGAGVATSTYDAHGNRTSYEDGMRAQTFYERDASGQLVSVTNPCGGNTRFERNARGNEVASTDALGGTVDYTYDAFSAMTEARDSLGTIIRYDYDERGNRIRATLPDGAVTQFRHDAQGNLVELVEPNGRPRRLNIDELGRVMAFTDEDGYETRFSYNGRGQLRFVQMPNGGVQELDYDADGNPTLICNADGQAYRFFWGGFQVIHAVSKPDGSSFHLRYDRENNLVRVLNEAGKAHDILRDAAGRIVGERTFDGRTLRYSVDLAGHFSAIDGPTGKTTFARDACGRIVERAYPDETADAFEYDALGRLICADNGVVRCEWTYDARGHVLRERQTLGGVTHSVDSEYTLTGKRSQLRTSLGHLQRIARDAMGLPRKVSFDDDAEVVAFESSGRDAELKRVLPRGGVVSTRYDAAGRVAELLVTQPTGPDRGHEPAWVGALPPNATHRRAFAYSPGGSVLEMRGASGERTELRYDTMGRILEWRPPSGQAQSFSYDARGALFEATPNAPRRSYSEGGQLAIRGDAQYRYDEASRLVEVRRASDGGGAWKYEWNGRGLLAAVVRPDGLRVENVYDALARRIEKRLRAQNGVVLSTTRFVWDLDTIVHEVREGGGAGKPAWRMLRTFAYRHEGPFPLAQHERATDDQGRVTSDSGWVHYVNGPGQYPSVLLSGSGEVVGELEADPWGRVRQQRGSVSTPLRWPGQYADEETGLDCHRHRFYDPEVGRFLSPDPIGLEGGLDPFAFVHGRPFDFYDPLGFIPVVTTITDTNGGSQTATSGGPAGPIHPVVEAAMPPQAGGVYPRGSTQPPTSCAEPRAVSAHLTEWERRNGREGRPLDPNDRNDHAHIQAALGSMGRIQSTQEGEGNRAPCANCSQMFANLHAQYGQPHPQAIVPGSTARGAGDTVNFTPPHPDWVRDQQASIAAGGGQSGPQPRRVGDPIPPPTGPAFPPHEHYGVPYPPQPPAPPPPATP